MAGAWLYVLLAVVFESNSPDPTLLAHALESCTEALVGVECQERVADPQRVGAAQENFVVQLTWHDPLHAHVEVRRALPEPALLGSREVAFSQADSLLERYRALGVVAASYVLPELPAAAQPAPSEPPAPPSSAERPAQRARLATELALLGGPGLDRGRPRAGATLRLLARPLAAVPALGLLVSARASHRPGTPDLTWADLGLGLSAGLPRLGPLHTELWLEAVGQRLFAKASDPDAGRVDRGGRFRLGGRLGLALLFQATTHLLPFLAADLAVMRPRVRLRVADRVVGEERAVEASLLLGARIAW